MGAMWAGTFGVLASYEVGDGFMHGSVVDDPVVVRVPFGKGSGISREGW